MPPETSRWPPSSSVSARASAFARTWRWYSRNASVPATAKQTALAAVAWHSGPPCSPGKTAESIFGPRSARDSTNPARGPASVLCVVEVTMSAHSTGLGCRPAATRPEMWAMSTMNSASTSSAIARKAAKSITRG